MSLNFKGRSMEIQLVQGSDEWKKWRKNGLGGSDAPIVMQVSPWRSPHDLWLEKCGLKEAQPTTQAMQRGLNLEGAALEFAEREIGVKFSPTVRKSRNVPYIYASLDGISEDGLAIEVKCPMRGLHDELPPHYLPQVQHQLFCIEAKMMLYMSFDGVQGKIIEVKRDDAYIEKLIEAERDFWHCVTSFTEPELSERDYIVRDDNEYRDKLMIYLNNRQNKQKWQELEDRSKEELIAMTSRNTQCMGVKIAQRARQGAVDYKTMTKDLDIGNDVITRYKKQPVKYWEIKEGK